MSTSNNPQKIIIVGAGIAGLTLANYLQKLEIDYVLLEASDEIAADVGTSFGLLPWGLRVLDQIGCYEDVLGAAAPTKKTTMRRGDGEVIVCFDVWEEMKRRHGYETLITERSSVLKALFNHIIDKSKLLVRNKVVEIKHGRDRVQVITKDGVVFEGSMVVGTDGVHSSVRKEMWRIADIERPGSIPKSQREAIKCDWGCVFGISTPTGGIPATDVNLTHKKGRTIAVLAGQGGKLFWFLFFKLETPTFGAEIPRFTKEDEAVLVKEEFMTPCTETVMFGDVYKNCTHTSITALPHHVFDKWYHGRMVIIGDSAHKFHPLTGYGGNSAMESAASLAGNLFAAFQKQKTTTGKATLDTAQIESVFQSTQSERHARATELVAESILQARLSAWDSLGLELADKMIVPYLPQSVLYHVLSGPILGAVSCKALPTSPPAHTMPYNEELQSIEKRRAVTTIRTKLGYIALLVAGIYGLTYVPSMDRSLNKLTTVVSSTVYSISSRLVGS